MPIGIYGIRNLENGKWYIGQSSDTHRRLVNHLSGLKSKRHHNPHLQCAFNKYGESNFEFRLLEEAPEGLLDTRERLWIEFYKSNQEQFGYNLESGGNLLKHHCQRTKDKLSKLGKGRRMSAEWCRKLSERQQGEKHWNYGKHPSEETRKKLREAQKRRAPISEETRQKRSASLLGHSVSMEARRKISEAHKGIIPSLEARRKMSEARKKRVFTAETRAKMSRTAIERKAYLNFRR
jgi:group I intron endonuclease